MATVHHRYATVRGRQLFYREAGPADAPAVVLLHGFPASSFMFRDLIPLLADRYHVIAPDHLGFGLSDAPPAERVQLHLRRAGRSDRRTCWASSASPGTRCTSRTTAPRWAGGSPWPTRTRSPRSSPRTATATRPASSTDFWKPVREFWQDRTPRDRGRRPRGADPGRDPVAVPARRPGRKPGQPGHLAPRLRPGVPARQRPGAAGPVRRLRHQPAAVPEAARLAARQPASRCWRYGAATTRSSAPTARSRFAADAPGAEICLLDGGHFLLESHLDAVADRIRPLPGEDAAMTGSLKDQTVLVIGRGSGLARAIALAAQDAGAQVIAAGREPGSPGRRLRRRAGHQHRDRRPDRRGVHRRARRAARHAGPRGVHRAPRAPAAGSPTWTGTRSGCPSTPR